MLIFAKGKKGVFFPLDLCATFAFYNEKLYFEMHTHSSSRQVKNIRVVFFLNLAFTALEIFGGFFVNSIAILSDALHDLGDSFSLGLSWFLAKKSGKKENQTFSFGYQRFSLLGALINSLVLTGGSIFVISEAIGRILEPQHSNAQGMVFFAIVGVTVNGVAAWKMRRGRSLNERVVSWHLLEDVLGWLAVLIVAIVLLFKDIHYLDPALSLLITLYVLWNVLKRLKETFMIFLQGVPAELDIHKIENLVLEVPNVQSLHHTHIWSLDGEHHVLSTHCKLEKINSWKEVWEVKEKIKKKLKGLSLHHVTIETEFDGESCFMDREGG